MKRLLLWTALLSACSSGPVIPKAGPNDTAGDAEVQALVDKADAAYAALSSKDQILPALEAYEAVTKARPNHKHALEQSALLAYYYANKVVAESDKDKRMAAYLRGREAGLRAMATNEAFRTAYEKDQDVQKQAALLGKDDVPGMYWAAVNWAKWGELYGIIRAAIDIPKVRALMDRANAVDPTYWGNAVDRFFMGYWVAIPSFAGRDAKKSKAAFDRGIAGSPGFLDNYVIFASYYCKDQEDKPLFESSLQKVLAATADKPEWKFFNDIARQEAKDMLAHEKEIFE